MKLISFIPQWTKWVLGIVLVAFISGFITPVADYTRTWMLDLITLGIDGIRDWVYRQVAIGRADELSYLTANMVSGVVTGFIFGLVLVFYRMQSRVQNSINEEDGEKASIDASSTSPEERLESLHRELESFRSDKRDLLNSTIRMRRIITISGAVFIIIVQSQVILSGYKVVALSHFENALMACSPVMADKEVLWLRSKFARMHGKDDFVKIMDELKTIASKNNLELHEFSVW